MNTVIGLFDKNDQANQVVRDLTSAGFDREQISEAVRAGEGSRFKEDQGVNVPGIGNIGSSGPLHRALSGGASRGEFLGALRSIGVPKEDGRYYAEGVRRGGTLVAVRADEGRTEQVVETMCRHGAIDCHGRATAWQQQGWQDFDTNAAALSQTDLKAERARAEQYGDQQRAIPVIEEEVRVGKREIERGGVRVWKHVTETPVEENVQLREERVNVERRPANRAVTDADVERAFKDETIEVSERSEEAVVTKDARVTEEVVVNKEATERTETIRDNVRKTEVEVEQIDASRPGQAGRDARTGQDAAGAPRARQKK